MKLSTISLLPAAASGYTMGGFSQFGRPMNFYTFGNLMDEVKPQQGEWRGPFPRNQVGRPTNFYSCSPRQQDQVNRAFESLMDEVKQQQGERRGPFPRNKAEIRKQKEWFNKAFGLMSEFNSDFISGKESQQQNEDFLRKQQEMINQAFDFMSGMASRPDIRETDTSWDITIEVPSGLETSDLSVSFEKSDKVLRVRGKNRDSGDAALSKSFKLEDMFIMEDADLEKITAKFNNGDLIVSIPKAVPAEDTAIKIPIS